MDEDGDPTPFDLTLHASDADVIDTLSWQVSSPASNGTATASGTGTEKIIGYTPDADFNGSDSFQVQVSDGLGGMDTITVTVTINPRNDPPANTVAPSISGFLHVGQLLTAVNGDWNDDTDLVPGTLLTPTSGSAPTMLPAPTPPTSPAPPPSPTPSPWKTTASTSRSRSPLPTTAKACPPPSPPPLLPLGLRR